MYLLSFQNHQQPMSANKCLHGKTKQYCQQCSPRNFCQHGRRKSRCMECGNAREVCEHGNQHYRCKDCKGPGWCEHNRRRSDCKDCKAQAKGGGSICEHGRQRSQCADCKAEAKGGGSRCEHDQLRTRCNDCGGGSNCIHDKRRSLCSECDDGGSDLCGHGKQKRHCTECDPAHNQKRWSRNFATSIIQGSKIADKKHNRQYDEKNYITKEWIIMTLEAQKKRCIYCCCVMLFGEGMNRQDSDGLTIERTNNHIAHIKSNCTLCCSLCNHLSSNIPKSIMNDGRFGPNLKEGVFRWCPGKAHGDLPEDHVREKEEFGKVLDYCKSCQRLYSKKRRATTKCQKLALFEPKNFIGFFF
jgi:hypothetical protein